MFAVLAGFFVILLIICLTITVILIVAEWMIYTKAGQPGWAVLIPIYNLIVLLRIIGKPWWWILLLMIPLVNIVVGVLILHGLSLSFGKGAWFTVGLIFLSIFFYPILGFGSAKYLGPGGPPQMQPETQPQA